MDSAEGGVLDWGRAMIHRPMDPAFPVSAGTNPGSNATGLTIRAHFAAMAMQGLMANALTLHAVAHSGDHQKAISETADMAAACADALIAALNK